MLSSQAKVAGHRAVLEAVTRPGSGEAVRGLLWRFRRGSYEALRKVLLVGGFCTVGCWFRVLGSGLGIRD